MSKTQTEQHTLGHLEIICRTPEVIRIAPTDQDFTKGGGGYAMLCDISGVQREHVARFIVTACNAHDDLLAENKWLRGALDNIVAASVIEGEVESMKYVQASCYHDMLKIARAALAETETKR